MRQVRRERKAKTDADVRYAALLRKMNFLA